MTAYYNEIDPFAAAWLRELIKAGAIADGEVSESDMWDVVPSELMGFDQVHLCAGIGGWSAALRLAGWPDDRPVWTVSLPCQPFSAAGKGAGLADERGQLADAFFWLAGVCRPVCIFGEQVEAAIKHDWWDVMASQLESIGYTVGAVGFPASSVGAFHLRQRLYWVAYYTRAGQLRAEQLENDKARFLRSGPDDIITRSQSPTCGLADAEHSERRPEGYGRNDFNAEEAGRKQGASLPGERGSTGIVGDSEGQGRWRLENEQSTARDKTRGHASRSSPANFWSDAEWIPCRDGKARPAGRGIHPLVLADADGNRRRRTRSQGDVEHIADESALCGFREREADGRNYNSSKKRNKQRPAQSSFQPLVNGLPGSMVPSGDNGPSEAEANATAEARVGRLRGYGNAIVVQAAAEFIGAFMET